MISSQTHIEDDIIMDLTTETNDVTETDLNNNNMGIEQKDQAASTVEDISSSEGGKVLLSFEAWEVDAVYKRSKENLKRFKAKSLNKKFIDTEVEQDDQSDLTGIIFLGVFNIVYVT